MVYNIIIITKLLLLLPVLVDVCHCTIFIEFNMKDSMREVSDERKDSQIQSTKPNTNPHAETLW